MGRRKDKERERETENVLLRKDELDKYDLEAIQNL